MELAHAKTIEEISTHFKVSEESGLTEEQVNENAKKFGYNGMKMRN